MKQFSAIALALLVFVQANAQPPTSKLDSSRPSQWQPEKTWVFVIGVLEYGDPNAGFPKEHRQDLELVDTLKKRGVPDSNIHYLLDKEATTSRVTDEFSKFLTKTQPGDWLILYYCGHGNNDANHQQTYLQTTDVSAENPGVRVGGLLTQIESSFMGKYVIIGADHCNSGGLVQSIKAWKGSRVGYAAFCSAHVNSSSTGEWTFTENLVYAFRGDGTMDDNNDGLITLAELGANVVEDMSFADDQMAQYIITKPLHEDVVVSKTTKLPKPGVGRRVEVEWGGEWFRALVIDREGDRFLVNYYAYPDQDNEWVESNRIRLLTKPTYPPGKKVRIASSGQWYPGKILSVRNGLHLVSFDGWGSEWNEWVSANRLELMTR